MKTFRICFLLLLSLLVPVRGAMAVAMLCPVAGGVEPSTGMSEQVFSVQAPAKHAAAEHDCPADAAGEPTSTAASAADACNACAAFCGQTPLLPDWPTLVARDEPRLLKFAGVVAPAPCHVSDGQERPPRSL